MYGGVKVPAGKLLEIVGMHVLVEESSTGATGAT